MTILSDKEFMDLMNKPSKDMTKEDYRKLYYHFRSEKDKLVNDATQAIEGYWKPTLDKYWKLCDY